MGQRLVVTITSKEEDICKLYYHWSAYTYPSLLVTKEIIECLYEKKYQSKEELLLRLIRFCESHGGGIDASKNLEGTKIEFEFAQKMFPDEKFKTENYNRSDGLIAFTEEGMQDMDDWAEGDVVINLDTDMVYFNVYFSYEDFDSYKEERLRYDKDFENVSIEDIRDIGIPLYEFSVDDIDNVIGVFDNSNEYVVRFDSTIYELIA